MNIVEDLVMVNGISRNAFCETPVGYFNNILILIVYLEWQMWDLALSTILNVQKNIEI